MPQKDSEKKAPELRMLGDRIKSLRMAKGYTNYEFFAFHNNIPRAQYGRYENGEDLRFSSLLKVLKALNISLKDFFAEGFGQSPLNAEATASAAEKTVG
jgi:transcriptional regulator with XRE-family HTH domain